ncbi:hypothetical protein RJT34_23739 [Clitoria ternatea]|uniref:Uncharacterized protein n=1 Tax=Clitoria ternatea TaxID=43366 RepID=A0AAN9FV69_CLITE
MSLYIGNLSEHSRRDELEHVFRRFGHCNVKIKRDGYGFVVFDFPPDAEKALRALKGRNICGQPLTLTWSNKQPNTHVSRFARGGGRNAHELQRERNLDRVGYARRKASFGERRYHKTGWGKSDEVPGEEREYRQESRDGFKDYVGEEKEFKDDFPDEGGGVIPNVEDNGRWGEPSHDPLVDNGNVNAVEFDRYEPQGHDRKHDDEDYHVGYSGGSPAANSRENVGRERIGEDISNRRIDSKFQQTCYRCGDPGHKMRNCPKEHSSLRKFSRLDVKKNNRGEKKHRGENENKFGSGSLGKLQSSGDALSTRHERDEQRLSGSRHHHAPLRNESSHVTRESGRHRKKEYGGKKRNRNEIETPKRHGAKMSKRSVSSPSDYSVSCSLSNSQSSKSLPRSSSRSRSRSVSSRSRSSSSKLRSSSKSQYGKGKSLNSRRSNSPKSLSVSVSLNQPLSSPSKMRLNSKSSSMNGNALESADHLVAQGQQIGRKMELENLQSKDTGIAVNGKAEVHSTAVDGIKKDQLVQDDNNENRMLLKSSDDVTHLTKPIVAGNLYPQIVKETKDVGPSGTLMLDDIPKENQKPASETHVNSVSDFSTTIVSTAEMCMVFNNCGLELPKDDEKNLTMDTFFGCARLWPWHIVYYRRLKKGPISTENYARRVAQNQEFGIVDKYIRSSSGWEECSLKNS